MPIHLEDAELDRRSDGTWLLHVPGDLTDRVVHVAQEGLNQRLQGRFDDLIEALVHAGGVDVEIMSANPVRPDLDAHALALSIHNAVRAAEADVEQERADDEAVKRAFLRRFLGQ